MSGLRRRLEAVEESVLAETEGRFSDEAEEKRVWMAQASVAHPCSITNLSFMQEI